MIRLLLVDDEPQLVRALRPALNAEGYEVSAAETGLDAIAQMAAEPSDVILLDLGLPDMDGKEVIRRLREWTEVPILVLSARDLEGEKIAALDLGADDFINKPFGIGELLARVRAALRGRERRFAASAVFRCDDLEINFATRRVTLDGMEIRLTPREYDLIRTLARHAGRVVTHKQLIAAVWGPASDVEAQFVRVLVGQVRQKLEADSAAPQLLLTEPGIGYRLRAED
ncbi:MAG TPA: response regulator transcription factor [Phenylobacterium sp.]|jgi:two-component system KDP operon response regulator KdpE|uniref:Response regulator n=1 Tax=Phenylobacterium conjunctum TaxID=1298959 RepID=A0ABW3T616_9CAUL|nr:response regulator transcription factor [Phenylobacterium sp.]HQN50198.1 response regulator transcription factor [Phenylobacterium sp.]